MALYANTPNQSQKGIYVGSGVAQGGNTARPVAIHNGIGTAIGGTNAGGSLTGLKQQIHPSIGTPVKPVLRPAQTVHPLPPIHPLAAIRPVGPVRLAAAQPPAPLAPLNLSNSSVYQNDLLQQQSAYNDAVAPNLALSQQVQQMRANLPGALLANKQAEDLASDQATSSLAASGLFSSGARDVSQANTSTNFNNANTDSQNQYGVAAQNALQAQIEQNTANATYNRDVLGPTTAASDAAAAYQTDHANDLQQLQGGVAAPPPAVTGRGSQAYTSGFFQNNSGSWYFLQPNGLFAPSKAPTNPAQHVAAPWVQAKSWAPAAPAKAPAKAANPAQAAKASPPAKAAAPSNVVAKAKGRK